MVTVMKYQFMKISENADKHQLIFPKRFQTYAMLTVTSEKPKK